MSALPIPPTVAPGAGAPLNPVPPAGTADAFESALRRLGTASSPPGVLAERVAHGLQSFRTRADTMSREVAGAMAPPAVATPPVVPPAPGSAAPAGAVATPSNIADPSGVQGMYRMVVRTFDFAMETHLVAKAATQFTGSINTLMKGQ